MKRALAAAALLSLFDIAAATAQAPTVNWSGFYLGAHGGFEWFDGDADVKCDFPCVLNAVRWNEDDRFIGGVHAGFDFDTNSRFLFGLVGDVSWGSSKASGTFFGEFTGLDGVTYPGGSYTTSDGIVLTRGFYASDGVTFDGQINVERDWSATLRARAGYLVSPNVLLYLTGGLAFLDEKVSARVTNDELVTLRWSDSEMRLGGTIGAGIEAALGKGFRTRLEYLYTNYGSHDYGDSDTPIHTKVDTSSSTVKIGFSYAFGGGS